MMAAPTTVSARLKKRSRAPVGASTKQFRFASAAPEASSSEKNGARQEEEEEEEDEESAGGALPLLSTRTSRRVWREGRMRRQELEEGVKLPPFCAAKRVDKTRPVVEKKNARPKPEVVEEEEDEEEETTGGRCRRAAFLRRGHAATSAVVLRSTRGGDKPICDEEELEGSAAALRVWRALLEARKKRPAAEYKETFSIDKVGTCDALVRGEGWIFSDQSGRLLRKTKTDATAFHRKLIARGLDRAEAHYDSKPMRVIDCVTERRDGWRSVVEDPSVLAVVAPRKGTRFRHSFRHDRPRTECSFFETVSAKWVDVRSPAVKKRIDAASAALVRCLEDVSHRRVRVLDSSWILDEARSGQNDPHRAVDDDDGDGQYVVEQHTERRPMLHACTRLVYGPKRKQCLPHVKSPTECPGGFCDWTLIEDPREDAAFSRRRSEHDDGDDEFFDEGKTEPRKGTKKMSRIPRSSILAASNEASSGAALDFWPRALVEWCLTRDAWDSAVSLKRPAVAVVFPTASTILSPGQVVEISWIARGPPPAWLSIAAYVDVEDTDADAARVLADELFVPRRDVVDRVAGDRHRIEWRLPVDLNGSCVRASWRFDVKDIDEDRIVATSQAFSVVDTRGSSSQRVTTLETARATKRDLALATARLRENQPDVGTSTSVAAEAAFFRRAEGEVRRWDAVHVCETCYEVYAELAKLRSAWLRPDRVEKRRQADAALKSERRQSLSHHVSQTAAQRSCCARLSKAKARPLVETKKKPRGVVQHGSVTLFDPSLPAVATRDAADFVGGSFVRDLPNKASQIRAHTEKAHPWAAVSGRAEDDDPGVDAVEPAITLPRFVRPPEQHLLSPQRVLDDALHDEHRRRRKAKKKSASSSLHRIPHRGYQGKLHSYQRLLHEQIQLQDDLAAAAAASGGCSAGLSSTVLHASTSLPALA